MGDKVDHWFKTYGTAVLNDTLRDGYVNSKSMINIAITSLMVKFKYVYV